MRKTVILPVLAIAASAAACTSSTHAAPASSTSRSAAALPSCYEVVRGARVTFPYQCTDNYGVPATAESAVCPDNHRTVYFIQPGVSLYVGYLGKPWARVLTWGDASANQDIDHEHIVPAAEKSAGEGCRAD